MSQVTLYTKDYCPYCKFAKALLQDQGVSYQEIDVSRDADKLQEMIARSDRRTVPQIFFGEEHVGGFEDLVNYFKLKSEVDVAA